MSSPGPRIAVGAIFTECNHLGGVPIDLSWFERYELYRGNAMLEIHSGVVGGMLEVLREQQAVPVPLLFASTCPGGPLTSDCYQQLKTQLLARLGRELPVAGVLLPLHGAMTVEDLAADIRPKRHVASQLFQPSALFKSQSEGKGRCLCRHRATPQMSRSGAFAGIWIALST